MLSGCDHRAPSAEMCVVDVTFSQAVNAAGVESFWSGTDVRKDFEMLDMVEREVARQVRGRRGAGRGNAPYLSSPRVLACESTGFVFGRPHAPQMARTVA